MIKVNNIDCDNRFYINKLDLERISKNQIVSYKFIDIPVGTIKRYLDKKIFSLYKTDAYMYLENPDNPNSKIRYQEYCKNSCFDYEIRGEKVFNELEDDISKNEYNPTKGVIVVDQHRIIMDGQHRACILLKKYGPKYKVKVVMVKRKNIGILTTFRCLLYDVKRLFNMDV